MDGRYDLGSGLASSTRSSMLVALLLLVMQSADLESAEKWARGVLPLLLAKYKPNDVYNADETALHRLGMATRGLPEERKH